MTTRGEGLGDSHQVLQGMEVTPQQLPGLVLENTQRL